MITQTEEVQQHSKLDYALPPRIINAGKVNETLQTTETQAVGLKMFFADSQARKVMVWIDRNSEFWKQAYDAASEALYKAAEKWSDTLGKFSTYFFRCAANEFSKIKAQELLHGLSVCDTYACALNKYRATGELPTDATIAAAVLELDKIIVIQGNAPAIGDLDSEDNTAEVFEVMEFDQERVTAGLERADTIGILSEFLGRLDDVARFVIVSRELQEMTLQEVADKLGNKRSGKPYNTTDVYNIQREAKETLRGYARSMAIVEGNCKTLHEMQTFARDLVVPLAVC